MALLFIAFLAGGCPGDDSDIESECEMLATGHQSVRREYQYDRFRLFDIGKFGGVNYLGPGDTIETFYLYQSVGTLDLNEPQAVAYPNSLEPESSPDSVRQRFRNVDIDFEYELIRDIHAGRYYIFFLERLPNVQTTTLAYHMTVKKADGSMLVFGDLTDVPFRLQMLKRTNPHPNDRLWDAEWKNVYDFGMRDIDYQRFNVAVFKGALGDEENTANLDHQMNGDTYLHLLGLDEIDVTGANGPDGKIDDNPELLYLEEGLVIFPNRYPFADSINLEDPVSGIYTLASPNDVRESSKYYLRAYESFPKHQRLDHLNIVEESETITLNSTILARGVDYFIDYGVGDIDLVTEILWELDQNDTLEICYDYRK